MMAEQPLCLRTGFWTRRRNNDLRASQSVAHTIMYIVNVCLNVSYPCTSICSICTIHLSIFSLFWIVMSFVLFIHAKKEKEGT